MNKGKPENSFNIAKNQELELIISKIHTEKSMKSNFFKKFKVIASTAHTSPIFQIFFFFERRKRFLRKWNLVLITSTVQVELSKLNYNFDDIRTYFLQALRDCRQIAFVVFNRFCPLSKKKPTPPALNGKYRIPSKIKWKIHNLFLHCISSFETSADIIFQEFLELHSTLTEKKIFVANFPF